MDLDLSGKRALVCGASKGLGKASAKALAELGAQVTLVARSAELLSPLGKELHQERKYPAQDHDFLVADFSQLERVRNQVQMLLSERTYHILVNNTGGPSSGPIMEAENEVFVQAFQKHILISHTLTQLLVPNMQKANYGRVINIISTSVKAPLPGLGVSNTIRAAMANWAKSMAGELARFGITVNNVLPGATDTERLRSLLEAQAKRQGKPEENVRQEWLDSIPAGRFGQPEEIGNAVAFLASPAAAYITGTNLTVDGGRTPSW